MARFAVIVDGVVENIIIAESQVDAIMATGKECVEYDPSIRNVGVGIEYDGTDFIIPEPPAPIEPPVE